MAARTAYRYAIQDETGRQQLYRDWVPARLSDVHAERVGDTVTLYDDAQVLEQVQVDPLLGDLFLVRSPLEGDGQIVTRRVRVAPAD